jgi:hypothetical protein
MINEEIYFLLINQSERKVTVHYLEQSFQLPLIGARPPFYTRPQYEPSFPVL